MATKKKDSKKRRRASDRTRQNAYVHRVPDAEGADFLREFLNSGVFTNPALAKLAPRGTKSKVQATRVDGILFSFEEEQISALDVIRAYAAQTFRYLALRTGSANRTKKLGDPASLAVSLGKQGWHGPMSLRSGGDSNEDDDVDDDVSIYVYCKHVMESYEISDIGGKRTFGSRPVRWSIVARVADGHATFHWDGFSHLDEGDEVPRGMLAHFRYWDHVDDAIDALAAKLDADWQHVDLHDLVYETLWKTYAESDDHEWTHLGINAERAGVAFNARSKVSVQIEGLRALTGSLAKQIAKHPQWKMGQNEKQIERLLLHEIIREWGTRSYIFQLNKKSKEKDGAPIPLFYGRVFMGNEPVLAVDGGSKKKRERNGATTADVLKHVLCYLEYNGSIPAARFLLDHV